MIQKLLLDYIKSGASPAVRWLVQMFAFWLVAQGYTDNDTANAFVDATTVQLLGILISLVTLALSVASKLWGKYSFAAALESSPDSSPEDVRQRVLDKIKGAV